MTTARTHRRAGSAWAPGREVRLKHGYYIKCNEAVKDAAGNVVELHCTYDPESGGGSTPDGRMVKGTLHWVSAAHAVDAEVRLYDYLFTKPDPYDVPDDASEGSPGVKDFMANFNYELHNGAQGLQGRADAGREQAGRALPVPPPGLFLHRP